VYASAQGQQIQPSKERVRLEAQSLEALGRFDDLVRRSTPMLLALALLPLLSLPSLLSLSLSFSTGLCVFRSVSPYSFALSLALSLLIRPHSFSLCVAVPLVLMRTLQRAFAEQQLQSDADQWVYWMHFLLSLEKLEADPVRRLQQLQTVVQALVASNSDGRPIRGPYLAEAEGFRRWSPSSAEYHTRLVAFVEQFASKPCCAQDLAPYLDSLDIDSRRDVLERCSTLPCCQVDASSVGELCKGAVDAASASAVVKTLVSGATFHQLKRLAGHSMVLSDEDRWSYAKSLWEVYTAAQPLSSFTQPTEAKYADLWAALCIATLLDGADTAGSVDQRAFFRAALMNCWKATEASPHNAELRLLLVRLFGRLGAGAAVDSEFRKVGIKYIQYDSLRYHRRCIGDSIGVADLRVVAVTCSWTGRVRCLHHRAWPSTWLVPSISATTVIARLLIRRCKRSSTEILRRFVR
jgi:hypothetical protein